MEANKTYYVIGPRNAWDTVPIGLFESKRAAIDNLCWNNDERIIREATPKEVEDFLKDKK